MAKEYDELSLWDLYGLFSGANLLLVLGSVIVNIDWFSSIFLHESF